VSQVGFSLTLSWDKVRALTLSLGTNSPEKSLRSSYWGTLLIKNSPPLLDHHRSLGLGLLYGPTGGGILLSEMPLYTGLFPQTQHVCPRESLLTSAYGPPAQRADLGVGRGLLPENFYLQAKARICPLQSFMCSIRSTAAGTRRSLAADPDRPAVACRGISLTRKRTLLGPYRRPMPRVLGGS